MTSLCRQYGHVLPAAAHVRDVRLHQRVHRAGRPGHPVPRVGMHKPPVLRAYVATQCPVSGCTNRLCCERMSSNAMPRAVLCATLLTAAVLRRACTGNCTAASVSCGNLGVLDPGKICRSPTTPALRCKYVPRPAPLWLVAGAGPSHCHWAPQHHGLLPANHMRQPRHAGELRLLVARQPPAKRALRYARPERAECPRWRGRLSNRKPLTNRRAAAAVSMHAHHVLRPAAAMHDAHLQCELDRADRPVDCLPQNRVHGYAGRFLKAPNEQNCAGHGVKLPTYSTIVCACRRCAVLPADMRAGQRAVRAGGRHGSKSRLLRPALPGRHVQRSHVLRCHRLRHGGHPGAMLGSRVGVSVCPSPWQRNGRSNAIAPSVVRGR
jgi:hypothetical protein